MRGRVRSRLRCGYSAPAQLCNRMWCPWRRTRTPCRRPSGSPPATSSLEALARTGRPPNTQLGKNASRHKTGTRSSTHITNQQTADSDMFTRRKHIVELHGPRDDLAHA